jgi:hypothetical protein
MNFSSSRNSLLLYSSEFYQCHCRSSGVIISHFNPAHILMMCLWKTKVEIQQTISPFLSSSLAPFVPLLNPFQNSVLFSVKTMNQVRDWGAISSVATQEFPSVLRKSIFHYRVQKSPALVPTISQINPVHTTPFYLTKIHLILPAHLRLGFPSCLFLSDFPSNILYASLRFACCAHS